MKRIALASVALIALFASANAQDVTNPLPPQSINGAYNASPPTCVDGHGCWLQTDINGQLKVSGSFSATTTNPVGTTPTDHTITSASGASQQIMGANATRHSLTIENTGNANCGVNPTGGTAVIGGAGTLTLAPLGSYSPRIPTLTAVTVLCTAGQPIYGDEN